MSHITDEELLDYLGYELPLDRYDELADIISSDTNLQERLADLAYFREGLRQTKDLEVSAAANERFTSFLREAIQAEAQPRRSIIRRLPIGRMASIAAAVLLVFALGWYFGNSSGKTETQTLMATRSLMLELMKNEKTSARIEATAVVQEVAVADAELINNLGFLLKSDPNANVRLAALTALLRFPDEPQVRQTLLDALDGDLQEVVRLQLIETLIQLREEKVIPYLETLIENDSLPRHLQDAARMGTFKLI
ncbi:MAG: HEAT repeat domain-containing protein [Bacteroidota bacterium]